MMKRTLIAVSLGMICLLGLFPAASQATPHGIPAGVYVTHITPADVPPDFPPDVAAALPGEWALEITGSGFYIVHKDGAFAVFGRYVSNPRRFVMHDEIGPLSCTGAGQATGIYNWTLDGDELTLTLVHDNCGVRIVPTTSHPFERQ
jgi:hypothetical protein